MISKSLTGLLCFAAIPAMAQFSGAIDTTMVNGGSVNVNLYQNKQYVYINGGPQNSNSNGLPPGIYYFQLTDPSGAVLLSDDPAVCRQLTVNSAGDVAGYYDNGGTITCHHANGNFDPASGTMPVQMGDSPNWFLDTPNNGGVYKAWLISEDPGIGCTIPDPGNGTALSIPNGCAKTDNFRIKQSGTCATDCTTPQSLISGLKFYDRGTNGRLIGALYTPPAPPNGNFDAGEPVLKNWSIVFTGINQGVPFTDTLTTDAGGNWADLADMGTTITVCEVLQSGWSQSGPLLNANQNGIAVIQNDANANPTYGPNCWSGTVPEQDVSSLNFGNYEAVTGTKYYDTNANGQPDNGEPVIPGFKIYFCDTFSYAVCTPNTGVAFTDSNGNYTFYLQNPGESYQISETLPSVNHWSQTGPLNLATPIPTSTGNGTAVANSVKNWTGTGGSATGLYLTNVCEGTDFPYTLGFWGSSPVGKAALAQTTAFPAWAIDLNTQFPGTTNLPLIGAATKTNPAPPLPPFSASNFNSAYAELSTFLMNATGSNAANMLSAQAATMALNTIVPVNGKTVSGTDLMLIGTAAQLTAAGCNVLSVPEIVPNSGGYASISSVLTYVEQLLGAYPNTTASGNPRSCQNFVQTKLNNANNNQPLTIIQALACTVTY